MKKYLIILLLLASLYAGNTQNYDQLDLNKTINEISATKPPALNNETYFSQQDTFALKTSNQDSLEFVISSKIPRNYLCTEFNLFHFSFYYERLFPLREQVGITTGAGLSIGILKASGDNHLVGESNFLLGGPKHFCETGATIYIPYDDLANVLFRIGYRYHHSTGFLIRVAPLFLYLNNEDGWGISPGISIGYSF